MPKRLRLKRCPLCRKTCYPSRDEAHNAIAGMLWRGDESRKASMFWSAYRCPVDRAQWHIGHNYRMLDVFEKGTHDNHFRLPG